MCIKICAASRRTVPEAGISQLVERDGQLLKYGVADHF